MILIRITNYIKRNILYNVLKLKWKKKNQHNYTYICNYFPLNKVNVGNYTYGGIHIYSFNNPSEKLSIGNFCSIAENVTFILGGEHHSNYISNYPCKTRLKINDIIDRASKGEITVGDDVWIGMNSIILSGVTIGQGAVIAAGSIVSKDVPPYSIYTTNKIIKYRFESEIIEQLLKIDYSKWTLSDIQSNIDLFYSDVTLKNIDKILTFQSKK